MNKEINMALELLVDQHTRRSKELILLSNAKGFKQSSNSTPPSPLTNNSVIVNNKSPTTDNNSISASLASARGIQNPQSLENFITTGSIIMTGNASVDEIDPLTKFQVQVYNLIKAPNLNNMIETPSADQPVKKTGKSVEELEIENQMLKQLVVNYSENLQVYESFHNKVKNNLRNYLSTLKKELQAQERTKKKEYEIKIDSLNKDNKKLESQIKKLKQRWDELVESAKKRRDADSQKENKS